MKWTIAAGALLLAGCASYQALPLPEKESLAPDAAHVRVDTAEMPTTAMRAHRFDPSDGFDITEVAMLAVANNPELKMLRADAGVTRAQAFSAGLLPDPQLSLSAARVMGTVPGATVAYSAGFAVDVAAWLARSSTQAAHAAEDRKTDLNLLWQEWQTVAKARLLFVKLTALAQSASLLDQQRSALKLRLERARVAVKRGLISSDQAAPLLTAGQDVERQHSDVERQINQARHDLDALVGLAPDVTLRLVGPADVRMPNDDAVRRALDDAARRRPDLLALQAGYQAEDERYRAALRAQFPAITIGPTRARDNSDVNTIGLSLGLNLPLFNRNRGPIAVELATREKLRLEYQQRLDAAVGDAHRLVAEDVILLRQRTAIDVSLRELGAAAAEAETAYTAGGVDALTLTSVEAALLAKRLEGIAVTQALWEQAIALQALLGGDLLVPDTNPSNT